MAAQVHVQILGPVRAVAEAGPLALRGRTARTVLARLALSAGTVVSVDQLTDALWDDDPPLEPAVSVRSIVSRLRTQLGRGAIVTDGAGYRLDTGLVDVDLAEIDEAMKHGRLGQRAPDELAALLDKWDGDALTDVSWTPTFEPERARIDELRARLVDAYHEAMLDDGRADETLADLERDAAASPLRESTQLLLMRALDACGRTAEALRSGAAYRERLIEQTGVEPSTAYGTMARDLLTPEGRLGHGMSVDERESSVATSAGRTWIPPDTPLVGREAELTELAQVAQQRRLVTITGPGGVGKTRLVTELVSRAAGVIETRVDMVSLASLDRASSVDNAVATALGIEVSSADTLRVITDRLGLVASTLVLDNCEHVLESARSLVQHLLRSVEDLRIIATSRRRLGLPDEAVFDVGPLALPATNTVDSAPMHLFMDRVGRIAPRLVVSERDAACAADICRLLDGLPLALELAAARVPMLGFEGLRQRLVDGLAVPGNRNHDDGRRQATIESTVEWSLALLSPAARSVFDDLSIFPSWFDLRGLEQISDDPGAVDAFSEIHDSSLVAVDHERPAYRLLEPVRQVAARQISEDVRTALVARYMTWLLSIVDEIDRCWIEDDRAAGQRLVIDHRADLRWMLNNLIVNGDAKTHGRVANVLSRALVERADIELVELCSVDVGPSIEGELARLIIAWSQGDHHTSESLIDRLSDQVGPDHDLWGYFNWARIPVYLYRGHTTELVGAAAVAIADERLCSSMRAESVALWACGLLYDGRRAEAAAVLADNEAVLELSHSGGFVSYARAEVSAVNDPELAIEHLAASAEQAAEANSVFNLRLTEVTRLVRLIGAHRTVEAAELTLKLVPELARAGTYPQAWTALRHVAVLLGQLDEPSAGLLVLDSANADPAAPAVTGGAIRAEEDLRAGLEAQAAPISDLGHRTPLGLAPLWEQVAKILRRQLG